MLNCAKFVSPALSARIDSVIENFDTQEPISIPGAAFYGGPFPESNQFVRMLHPFCSLPLFNSGSEQVIGYRLRQRTRAL